MADPLDIPKYRNAPHAAYTIIKEEGIRALYKGVTLTALRQGNDECMQKGSYENSFPLLATNQAANFTAYQEMKKVAQRLQELNELPSYQHLILGGVSGAMGNNKIAYMFIFIIYALLGPFSNAPIDTIKTRIQKSSAPGSGYERFKTVTSEIMKKEGFFAFYKGLTPRLLRVAPGQAVTFMVYEKVRALIDQFYGKTEMPVHIKIK